MIRIQPIPQNPIGDDRQWRDWFNSVQNTIAALLAITGLDGQGGSTGVNITYGTYIATTNQKIFTLTAPYVKGNHSLQVFVNGAHLTSSDYTETSTIKITLAIGLRVGDILETIVFS